MQPIQPPQWLSPTTINFLNQFTPSINPQTATKPTQVQLLSKPTISTIVKTTPESKHKGQNGRIILLGGSQLFSGAPYFATRSAIQIGADLIQIICEITALDSLRSLSPDIMCHGTLPSLHNYTQFLPSLQLDHVTQEQQEMLLSQNLMGFARDEDDLVNITKLFLQKIPYNGILPPQLYNIIYHNTYTSTLDEQSSQTNHTKKLDHSYWNYFYHCYSQLMGTCGVNIKNISNDNKQHDQLISKSTYSFQRPSFTTIPPPNIQSLTSISTTYIAGTGLGTDQLTMSMLNFALPTLLWSSVNMAVFDANALTLFHSPAFIAAVRFRPKVVVQIKNDQTQKRRDNDDDDDDDDDNNNNNNNKKKKSDNKTFNNTVLTPNKRELTVLYQTLTKQCTNQSNACSNTSSPTSTKMETTTKSDDDGDDEKDTDNKAQNDETTDTKSSTNHIDSDNTGNKDQNELESDGKEEQCDQESTFLYNSLDHTLTIMKIPGFVPKLNSTIDTSIFDYDCGQSTDLNTSHLFSPSPNVDDKTPSTSPTPPKITSDDSINTALAISRYLNGVTVYVKGEVDIITNGEIVVLVQFKETSSRRCGGQGDITCGLVGGSATGVYKAYSDIFELAYIDSIFPSSQQSGKEKTDSNNKPKQTSQTSSTLLSAILQLFQHCDTFDQCTALHLLEYMTPPILSAIFASYTLKLTALDTFNQIYTGTTADTIIDALPMVLKGWKTDY